MLVGNLYSSGLASIMTVTRYEKPIDTIEDLLDSGLIIAGPGLALIYSLDKTEDVRNFKLFFLDTINSDQPFFSQPF